MMRRGPSFRGLDDRVVFAAAVFIGLLAIVPVFAVRYLPLHDYPFHLARIVILAGLDNPVLAQFYAPGSFLLPNIGMDAVAVPLSALLGAENATRAFVAMTLLTALFGTMILHRAAHGRWSAFPLLAVLFLHNGIFRFGFFNYLFGMGLALAAAGWWMMLRPGLARFAIGLICAILLLWCHFEAFAVYAVVVGGLEIGRAFEALPHDGVSRALSGLVMAALPFLVCLLLFWLMSPTAGVAGKGFAYAPGLMTKPVGGLFALSSGSGVLDIVSVLAPLGVCGWLALSGNLTVSRPLAFAVGAMVIGYFAAPSDVMGALYADVRLAPALALLMVAALDIRPGARPVIAKSVAGLCVALAVLRLAILLPQWQAQEAVIAPMARAIERIEPGSTLFMGTQEQYPSLIADTPQKKAAWQPPLKHVASFAVLGSPVFVPITWADPTQQPLAVKPDYRPIYKFQGNPKKLFTEQALMDWIGEIAQKRAGWPQMGAIYLLVVGRDHPAQWPASVSLAAQGDRFMLLKFNP